MKRIIQFIVLCLAAMSSCGCQEDQSFADAPNTINFIAHFDQATKTSYEGNGIVFWEYGDIIHYYTKDGGEMHDHVVSENGLSTILSAVVDSDSRYITAVHGGDVANNKDGNSFTLRNAINTVQSGRFEDAHVSVAFSEDLIDGSSLSFRTITSLIKFRTERSDVDHVVFEALGGEVISSEGELTICVSDFNASAEYSGNTSNKIRINTGAAGTYFITTLPVVLSKGFAFSYYSSSNDVIGKTIVSEPINIKRGTILNLGSIDEHIEKIIDSSDAVDLGLSVKWAPFNVGAYYPEGKGAYYAWGEVETKSEYTWENYKWCYGSPNLLTKYITAPGFIIQDDKTTLEHDDDIASVAWGDHWRIPTEEDWLELSVNCNWEWRIVNGVSGYRITSAKNNNSIFLPATGYMKGSDLYNDSEMGHYWASTVSHFTIGNAWNLYFYGLDHIRSDSGQRYLGQAVRAVYDERQHVSSVSIEPSSVVLGIAERCHLSISVKPEDSFDKSVKWTSADDNIVTVSSNGVLTANGVGVTTIMAYSVDGGHRGECVVTVVEPEEIDLGLSVKWASLNLGSHSPEHVGEYFAWGEIQPYYLYLDPACRQPVWEDFSESGYYWTSYRWCKGNNHSLTKYSTGQEYGVKDDNITLDLEDDAANVLLKKGWRIPTRTEWEELKNSCTWTWGTQNGYPGYLVTSNIDAFKNQSIFLPANGFIDHLELREEVDADEVNYWSSSLNQKGPAGAWRIHIYRDSYSIDSRARYYGFAIRPVK